MEELLKRLKQQEDEVKELEAQLFGRPEFKDNRKLEELRTENDKLHYRANILIRSIEEIKKQPVQANATGNNKDKKQQSAQAKSTEKKPDDSKNKKEKSDSNQKDDKNKKPAAATAIPPKSYFTYGAEGDAEHAYRTLDTLIIFFEQAIRKAFPEDPTLPVLVVPGKQTDYQCNSAMPIAQKLGATGKKIAPIEVAKIIVDNLPKHEMLHKVEFSGPGFINVTISPAFVSGQIRNILLKGVLPPNVLKIVGSKQGTKKPKVIIDFSSPNIAKEMHVGHLRSTIIGDSLARLLEYVGFDVLRLNHLGDWGTQFGMLIAHLQDIYPEYKTQSPPISDLLSFYKASKKRFDEEEDFKKRAYECVVKLQAFDPDITHAWKLICEVSRRDFQYIYNELDIKIIDRGESFYQSRMIEVVKELQSKNLLKKEAGEERLVMFLPGIDVPMTIVKSDGSFTYDTSDMATIKQRLQEENGDWLIYVIDCGQALHMQSIFAGAKLAGWTDGKENVRIDHVGFGVVLGEDGKKLKSRSGETIRLRELLNEGIERSKAKLIERERQNALSPEEFEKAQKSVTYGCIKYADLSHNRNADYIFSFDRMLDDRGNTAAYLLYAYTRIRSIARTAGVDHAELKAMTRDIELNFEKEERELKLAKCIIRYPDVMTRVVDELLMHGLCEYMYQLATAFTDFYDRCYCIEKDKTTGEVRIHYHRILLCEATANVLKQCFDILGIQPLDRM